MDNHDEGEHREEDPRVEWSVVVGPDTPDLKATVVLRLSTGGRVFEYRLEAKAATLLSNALIVQSEKAQFLAARRQ